MRTYRARLARLLVLPGTALSLAWCLVHCGTGSSGQPGPDGGGLDSQAYDSSALDSTVPDAPGSPDSTMGGDDAADAADDPMEEPAPRIPCVPTSPIDAGGDADAAGADGATDGGDAGDAAATTDGGEAGPTSDAAPPAPCPDAMTCCGGWCTDTTKDPQNCGSCGNACTASQFCTGVTCDDAVLQNVCASARATVVLDPYATDNQAGTSLGAALATGCMPPVTVTSTPQDSGVAEYPSGRPHTGPGNILIAGGGFFGQRAVAYLEDTKIAPLTLGTDGTNGWIRNNKTGVNVVLVPNAMLTSQHDYFALEVTVEPKSGTLCFFGYGMEGPGTAAAAYYFQSDVVANRAMFPDVWYVYEWTDTDNSGMPSAGDTFTAIAHGT
jgi:hypothetical protein